MERSRGKMLKIPKNVMQIGTGSPNVKLYMEDYVHTFLERCQGKETCLAFGQQEEKDGVRYYLIYGAEKETDFRRGNFPYFQKLDRIGKIEKKEAAVRFWTVRGEEIQIGGYFIFYEQNEEMQAYMIAERERNCPAAVEEERVMEAISARREKRKAEAAADAARGTTASRASAPNTARSATASRASASNTARGTARGTTASREPASNTASGRKTVLSRLGALKASAPALNAASRKTAFGTSYQTRLGSTDALFPKLCRIGCLVLLLVLVGTALTSVNQYPDMKAVSALFTGALRNTKNETKNISSGLIVEETVGWNSSDEMARSAALDEAAQADDTTGTANTAMDGEVTDNRTTDNVTTDNVTTDNVTTDSVTTDSVTTDNVTTDSVMADGQNAVTTDADAESSTARQSVSASDSSPQVQEALALPESYQVQKGDSLIAISRRFYGTDEKVIEICRLNNIKDPNQIQPGQNIILPSK